MLIDLYQFGLLHSYKIISCAILVSFLLALTYTDLTRYQLPDRLTLSLLWTGLLLHAVFNPHSLASSIFGAAGGYLSLWSLYWLIKLVTKKEGLGYGDFKLMAALGAWLGWECLPFVAVYASVMGILAYIARFILLRNKGEIPFGPFLAGGGGAIYISQQVYSLADSRCVVCVTLTL